MWNAEPAAGRNQEGRGHSLFSALSSRHSSLRPPDRLWLPVPEWRSGPTIGGAPTTSSQEPPPRLVIRTLINGSFEPNLETR